MVVTTEKSKIVAKSSTPIKHTTTAPVNESNDIDIVLNSVQKHSRGKVCKHNSKFGFLREH